jgi:hypothetical protein
MEIKMFQARISMSDNPKLNVNCRSVGVVADGGTCKYTIEITDTKEVN